MDAQKLDLIKQAYPGPWREYPEGSGMEISTSGELDGTNLKICPCCGRPACDQKEERS